MLYIDDITSLYFYILWLIASETDGFIHDSHCMNIYYLHKMWRFSLRFLIKQAVEPPFSSVFSNYGKIAICWQEYVMCCKRVILIRYRNRGIKTRRTIWQSMCLILYAYIEWKAKHNNRYCKLFCFMFNSIYYLERIWIISDITSFVSCERWIC